MGYMLSSLAKLPIEKDVSIYIFAINSGWGDGPSELIDDNFEKIASRIGPSAVIVKGLNGAWTDEVAAKYLGRDDANEVYRSLPALLITDTHPEKLTRDSLRLLIPVARIEKRFSAFFSCLSKFATNKDLAFLERFFDADRTPLSEIVSLNPGFFGAAINLQKAYQRLGQEQQGSLKEFRPKV